MLDHPEPLYPSLTPLAVQERWKVPTEFPSCPDEFTDDGLMLYASRLSFGTIFARNDLSTSLVVEHRLRDDDLIVLTRFAGEPIKDWAVAHISVLDSHFLHRSEFTFFTLQGALKHFCELAGEQFGESMDDYC
ncbi:hypothetical protein [Paradevosia shaoguanensis]|uniref:hypothetical protein n=1 Tax=Paradevosia shaoguanensis TaxID=1335043 RepID=UPI00362C2072